MLLLKRPHAGLQSLVFPITQLKKNNHSFYIRKKILNALVSCHNSKGLLNISENYAFPPPNAIIYYQWNLALSD